LCGSSKLVFFGEVILQLGKYLKYKIEAIKRMIEENIKVNSRIYKVTVNDQTQMYAARLRKLYQQTYNDMDSYEEVSSETSTTVNNLLNHAVSPDVKEEDMDGVIHQVLKIFDKPVQKTKKTR
jgi:hypothetical protein